MARPQVAWFQSSLFGTRPVMWQKVSPKFTIELCEGVGVEIGWGHAHAMYDLANASAVFEKP